MSTTNIGNPSLVQQQALSDDQSLILAIPPENLPIWLVGINPITVPKTLLNKALPNRDRPGKKYQYNAKECWDEFIAVNKIFRNIKTDFTQTNPALQAAYQEAWHRVMNNEMEGSQLSDAVLFALFCKLSLLEFNASRSTALTDFLVAHKGLVYAIEVLILAINMKVINSTNRGLFHESYWVAYFEADEYQDNDFFIYQKANVHFRYILAQASESLWQECCDKLMAALPKIPLMRQPLISILLPEHQSMANSLATVLLEHGLTQSASYLKLVITDKVQLEKLHSYPFLPFFNTALYETFIATLLVDKGIEGAAMLVVEKNYHDGFLDILAHIGIPECIIAIGQTIRNNKSYLTRFMQTIERWPLASIAALPELLATDPNNQVYRTCLINLLISHQAVIDSILPWISQDSERLIQQIRSELTQTTDYADINSLPTILVSPPWLTSKTKKNATFTLPLLSIVSESYFTLEEQALVIHKNSIQTKIDQACQQDLNKLLVQLGIIPKQTQSRMAFNMAKEAINQLDVEKFLTAVHSYSEDEPLLLDFHYAMYLPDELALALWNTRSRFPFSRPDAILVKFGVRALPGLINLQKSHWKTYYPYWNKITSAQLAPCLADIYINYKPLRHHSRQALLKSPKHSIIGLLPDALGKAGKTQKNAQIVLQLLASAGHHELILSLAEQYNQPKIMNAIKAILTACPLDDYPNKIPDAPFFWQPSLWRRPKLKNGGKALPDSALNHLGSMLRFPVINGVYAGFNQIKEICDEQSLADFAWDLFEAWIVAGSPSKENWVFTALGILGNDDSARKITPLIRQWPTESQYQRAVNALEILSMIGSDVSLMLLNGIAQKVKSKGLQDKAKEKIEQIAETRELSVAELEDRLAPNLGLDENGSLILDFGPRQFTLSFNESLKPFIRDHNGTILKDLPTPKQTDDPTLSSEAISRYKLLKKDARTVAKQQIVRLEQAMCQRRRWHTDLFLSFLVHHPLLRHLVKRLVFGVYSVDESHPNGKLQATFRVAEDSSFTTSQDETYHLPQGEEIVIGLPHQLELSLEETTAFKQLFSDYQLIQPFIQLNRETYRLDHAQLDSNSLSLWQGTTASVGRILALANRGWHKGFSLDSGVVAEYIKPINNELSFHLQFEPGIILGMVDELPEQTLELVMIDQRTPQLIRKQSNMSFLAIDDISISELIRDLEQLKA